MLVRPARGIDRADPPDAEVGPRPSRGAGPTAGRVDLVADRRAASVVEPGQPDRRSRPSSAPVATGRTWPV
jgi:hypothetical protein